MSGIDRRTEELRRLTYPRYSLTELEDDRLTDSNPQNSPTELEGDRSTDSTIDTVSDYSMVEVHNPTEVEDLLQKQPHSELTAILTPTKMDIINFTDAMATALTFCKSKLALTGGQAYLVLTKAEFKIRVQN